MRIAGMFLIALLFCCCTERDASTKAGTRTGAGLDTVSETLPAGQAPPATDTILADRFADGGLRYLILARDSGECRELHQSFYANGRLKSSGCQGTVQNAEVSTGMSVGTWTYYDSLSGRVDSTFFYDNSASAKAYIEKKSFFANGRVRAVERFNNYVLYETEMRRIGVSRYYDEAGAEVRVEKH